MTGPMWWGAELLEHGPPEQVWASAGRDVSRGELRREVERLARTLKAHGIRGGHTVAVHGTASFTQIWCIFALLSMGAQVFLLDPRVRGPERSRLLLRCTPQFLVSLGRGLSTVADPFVDGCEIEVRRLPHGQEARTSHCVVHFTSGTTGPTKVVGRTSESLLVELDRLRLLDGMPREGERVAVLDSVTRSFGLVCGLLYALDSGATVVFPRAGTPRAVAEAAAASDVVLGNPGHFAALVAAPARVTLPRLRLGVSAGDVLPPDVAAAFAHRYGVRVGQAYGMTETGIIAADLAGTFGTPTIGIPVPGVRTRVVDGVLEVHVPQSPYLHQQELWVGGWMSTQDMVSRDPVTGALRLRGRLEDTGQAHVDLLEIESVLRAHEQVSDAVVLGVDPIEAHVASTADLDQRELRSWCHRFLRTGAVPARYHVVRELPRTPNGKLLRNRDRLRERSSPLSLAAPGEG